MAAAETGVDSAEFIITNKFTSLWILFRQESARTERKMTVAKAFVDTYTRFN